MIRNLIILGFAACLTGISRCDKDFGFKNTAYDNFDVYDEYQGSFRMQYGDYERAESNPNVETQSDTEDTEQIHPSYNASSKTEGATATLSGNKIQATNRTKTQPKNKPKPISPTKSVNGMNAMVKPNTTSKGIKPEYILNSEIYNSPYSSNGAAINTPAPIPEAPKKGFVNIKNANPVVTTKLPKFPPYTLVFFMLHGFMESEKPNYKQDDYVNQFFKTISSAILSHCECYVIGTKWSFQKPPLIKPFIQYKAAITAGKRLGNDLNRAMGKEAPHYHFVVIGHDLGNLAAASLANVLKKPVDFIYGLDQRLLHGSHKNFYLRRDLGRLVQTLTTNGMIYNYGHRNFYPNGGNLSQIIGPRDRCFYCYSFELLADAIRPNGGDHESTFCSTYTDYVHDYCENMPQASYFNKFNPYTLPVGSYFITEPLRPKQPLWT